MPGLGGEVSEQGRPPRAEELQLNSRDNEEAVAVFNWGITCSDLSAAKVSLAAVWKLVRGRRALAAER